MDEGKAVDVVCLDFSKALAPFPTTFSWRNWLLMVWMGALFPPKANCLAGQAQSVVMNGFKPAGSGSLQGFPRAQY